jgi:4-amino-4-deoxy-L-arabinose transferase-like glycosyltransferase
MDFRSAAVEARVRRFSWLLELAALVFCALMVWATAIGSSVNHNEQMYVAAARLWWQLRLYTDYAYLQAPLLPMVNAALFAIADNEHLLLVARLHVALWSIVALCSVYELGRRLTASRAVGIGAAVAFASHRLFLSNAAESSNYMMPLALAILSLLASVLAADESFSERLRARWCGLSGVAIGLAVTCKSFYVVLAVGLFAMALAAYDRKLVLHWVAGAALGALPLLYYTLRDPSGFYFGNLGYHIANTEYRRASGSNMPMGISQKLRFVRRMWREPFLIGLTIYALAGVVLVVLRRVEISIKTRRVFVFAWLLTLLACICALLPSPSYLQYYAIPYAFLIITGIAAAGLRASWWRASFVALCLLGVAFSPTTWELATSIQRKSTPARMEREAKKLGEHLACSQETYVATLSPILALEAGCNIYPELATGPFAFRVADDSTDTLQEELNVVGSSRLESFLDAKKPHAILVGFEPRHDHFFKAYAKREGYVEVDERFMRRGRLWVAPQP